MAINTLRWHKPKWLPRLLAMPIPDPSQHAARILGIQRNIVLPAKLVFTVFVFYYLFYSELLKPTTHAAGAATSPQEVFIETLQGFFIFYIIFSAVAAATLVLRRFPLKLVPWVVFSVGLVDGLLLAGLTTETGGFGSNFYWVFPGLILINALSIPLAMPQIVLNLLLSAFYLGAGVLNSSMGGGDLAPSEPSSAPVETKLERLAALKFAPDDIINLESFAAKLKNPADPAGVSHFVGENLSPATRGLLSNYNGGVDPALQKALEQDWHRLVQDGLEPLAGRLKDPAGPEAVSRFLTDHLSPATRGLLSNYNGGADPPLQKALAEDLTRIVQGGQIYNARRFTNVTLSADSANQLKDIARIANPARLNHALLLDAFPGDLSRTRRKKDKFMENNSPVQTAATRAEPYILRLIILWLMTGSCYGVQLLSFRQRLTEEEVRKSTARNDELKAAGRLAAEIAHQLKNPLGIINNAVFTLRRGLKDTKNDFSLQMDIIREEIDRSDHILTQLMGYAQLSEGRVEKLNLAEELDRAIADVLPPGSTYEIQIQRKYSANLPLLVMQRSHLTVVLVNLIQNAREVLKGRGIITVQAHCPSQFSLEISVADDGPGISPENIDKVFEAYFTNKEKGTGLGLAIVRHNVELYGGAVWVESGLGKGARFVISFPAKAFIHSAS